MTLTVTQFRYQQVVELYTLGDKTQQEIATVLEISLATVKRYLSMWRRNVPVEEVRSVGRPTRLTDSVRGSIVAQLQRDEFSTSGDIARSINETEPGSISGRSVRPYLGRLEYTNSLPRVVPFITNVQKNARVHWAHSHSDFDWKSVFFSDETTIQLSANITRAWHRSDSRPICRRSKYPVKVMFWGAIAVSRKSPLLIVSGTLNAQGYQTLLRQGFLPWFQRQHMGRLRLQ